MRLRKGQKVVLKRNLFNSAWARNAPRYLKEKLNLYASEQWEVVKTPARGSLTVEIRPCSLPWRACLVPREYVKRSKKGGA